MTHEENEALTRVGRGTLMGDLLRQYWHPVARSSNLIAREAPTRVSLLGDQYVAFRTEDGRVGFVNERCPHRGVSLALAHNHGNGLRCIFHGWKIDVSGKVVHIPTEPPETASALAEKVHACRYATREAGGLLWVYVGDQERVPRFPDFEFTHLPEGHVDIRIGLFRCNWLQAMEAVLDSAHLGQLHRNSFPEGWLNRGNPEDRKRKLEGFLSVTAPRFDIAEMPYGFNEAAIRDLPDGRQQISVRQFAAPYHVMLPVSPQVDQTLCISVPSTDELTAQYFVTFNTERPLAPEDLANQWKYADEDPDNIRGDLGGIDNLWGQDRRAMQAGHASGFPGRHSFQEDFVCQESMGAIADRTVENLGVSDTVIVYTRRKLLEAARHYRTSGERWSLDDSAPFDYRLLRGTARIIAKDADWKTIDPFSGSSLNG